ncbi:hypothetical protein [Streptantibioticus ferralitis]|uniref:hypothetical protein n=1 Tax=Streptantibioticus ferralitis TaxID=236510 RepID=UPI0031CDC47E
MTATLNCDVLASVIELPCPEWNRLARQDVFYASHEWLTMAETEAIGERAYVVFSGGLRLVAAVRARRRRGLASPGALAAGLVGTDRPATVARAGAGWTSHHRYQFGLGRTAVWRLLGQGGTGGWEDRRGAGMKEVEKQMGVAG